MPINTKRLNKVQVLEEQGCKTRTVTLSDSSVV